MNRTRFSAVNTKVRVLERGLLSDRDFLNLLEQKSVNDVAAYLKQNTHYSGVLKDINEYEVHRGQLESLIKKDHAKEIRKLSYYFKNGYKRFFRFVFIKREIEELKKILRSIRNGHISSIESESLVNIGVYCKVDKDRLLESKTISEFIKILRDTIYYKYLKPFEEDVEGENSFMGEMVLDLAYFEIFYDDLKKINKKDRKLMHKIQGTNVDLLNIQWIYRGLKYYSFSRELLFNYTIPHGYHLNVREIRELCYSDSIDEFKKKVSKYKYNFLFEEEDIFMERRDLRYQYKNIKKIKAMHEMDLSEAISFDILLEYEIRDIITLIEGIRYSLKSEETKKFLIREL